MGELRDKSSLDNHMFVKNPGDVRQPVEYQQPNNLQLADPVKFGKKSMFKRLSTALFGEDEGRSMGKELYTHIIKPNINQAMYSTGNAILRNVLFGEAITPASGYNPSYRNGDKRDYTAFSGGGFSGYNPRAQSYPHADPHRANNVMDYQAIPVSSRIRYKSGLEGDGYTYADDVLTEIKRIWFESSPDPRERWINVQTVADVLGTGGVPWNATNYGWENLDRACVKKDPYSDGYIISLPNIIHKNDSDKRRGLA